MNEIKFLCDRVVLFDHKTGEVISETQYTLPHPIDFEFPSNINLKSNNMRCGISENTLNNIGYELILRLNKPIKG